MASAVMTIPDEVISELKRFSWVNWSEAAREGLAAQAERLNRWREVEKIVAKSHLTQEQADKMSDELNWSLAKRYKELLKRK